MTNEKREDGPVDARRDKGAFIRLRSLSRHYGVLTALDAGAGKVLAIIGPGGSGKSTLLRCINWLKAA